MNHLYAIDDSEIDNVCEVCGSTLDRFGQCKDCIDTDNEDKYMEEYKNSY